MSLVQEIQEIISDKSHTQNEMVSYIQSHYGKSNKTLVEITIPIFLQGNLDLGILNSLYPSLQYLYFTKKGKITGLYNIPKKLEQLHCTNQLLTELTGLPSSLQVLNISHNVLSKLDLFSCKQLKRLYCDHNRLIYISGLPESLLVIHCNNNRLNFLDLGSTPKLEVFRHHKNRQLVLRNVPSTIKEGFEFVEQMIVDYYSAVEEVDKEYVSKLEKFFSIKNNYEQALKSKRKSKTSRLPICIGCKEHVGMVFSFKDRKYSAHCGGNPPCQWKMVINRGFYHPFQEILESYEETVDMLKQSIIQHKMDVLFNHMDQEKAMRLHKNEMDAYQTANEFLSKHKKTFEEYYFSDRKNEEIDAKLKTIHEKMAEVIESIENDDLRRAVEIEYHDILPLYQNIQSLEYEVTETQIEKDRSGKHSTVRLFQQPVHQRKLEMNLVETIE